MSHAIQLISRAALLAARGHSGQTWKDGKTPYVVHLADVTALLADASGADDPILLAAAWLHDIVEDGHAQADEIEAGFGREVRDLVCELTDDMSLPAAERKRRQVDEIAGKSRRARLLKLADKISNLRQVALSLPPGWTEEDRREYAEWGRRVVDAGCRGLDSELERKFDRVVATFQVS